MISWTFKRIAEKVNSLKIMLGDKTLKLPPTFSQFFIIFFAGVNGAIAKPERNF